MLGKICDGGINHSIDTLCQIKTPATLKSAGVCIVSETNLTQQLHYLHSVLFILGWHNQLAVCHWLSNLRDTNHLAFLQALADSSCHV